MVQCLASVQIIPNTFAGRIADLANYCTERKYRHFFMLLTHGQGDGLIRSFTCACSRLWATNFVYYTHRFYHMISRVIVTDHLDADCSSPNSCTQGGRSASPCGPDGHYPSCNTPHATKQGSHSATLQPGEVLVPVRRALLGHCPPQIYTQKC